MRNTILLLPLLLFTAAAGFAQIDNLSLSRYSAMTSVVGNATTESYVHKKEMFYVLPDEVDISTLDGMDIGFMRPRKLIRHEISGIDSLGSMFSISEILNPKEYFEAHHMEYSVIIVKDSVLHIYDDNEELMYEEIIGSSNAVVDTSTATSPSTTFQELSPGVFTFDSDSLEIVIDTHTGIEKTTIYNLKSEWEIKSVAFFDFSDTLRTIPLYEMDMYRETLPSGECVFRVVSQEYAKYVRKSQVMDSFQLKKEAESKTFTAKIWPNPATDIVAVLISNVEEQTEGRIELYSIDGKMVRSQKAQSGQYYQLDVTDLSSGMYIMRLTMGKESLFQKIIIQ